MVNMLVWSMEKRDWIVGLFNDDVNSVYNLLAEAVDLADREGDTAKCVALTRAMCALFPPSYRGEETED